MYEKVISNTAYGPAGETYRVRVVLSSGHETGAWYWTKGDALAARDRVLDLGLTCYVDGLPTVICGG